MTLKLALVDVFNSAQARTWNRFEHVKRNALTFNLDPAKASAWLTPGEPALVRELISRDTLGQIEAAIRKHLSGIFASSPAIVSSIFIHQKPKVLFDSGKEAEIGDLLLVRQHFQTGQAVAQGKAFLLQAKISIKPKTRQLKGNELVQFNLYNGWTYPFTFPYEEYMGTDDWDFADATPPRVDFDETGVYAIGYKHKSLLTKSFVFPDKCAWAVGKMPWPSTHPTIDASIHSLPAVVENFVQGKY